MSEILNTNLLKKEDKVIQVGEKVYKIPSGLPTKLYLRLLKCNQGDDPIIKMEEGINVLIDIFKIRQPKLNEDELLNELDVDVYTAIINNIFADMSIEETMERLKEAKDSVKDGKKKPLQVES
jgi:hypothetical protein